MLVISLTGPGQLGKIVFHLRKVTRRGSIEDTIERVNCDGNSQDRWNIWIVRVVLDFIELKEFY